MDCSFILDEVDLVKSNCMLLPMLKKFQDRMYRLFGNISALQNGGAHNSGTIHQMNFTIILNRVEESHARFKNIARSKKGCIAYNNSVPDDDHCYI